MVKGGNKQPAIDNAEHIGPDDTGDNIEAKRVAPYEWNGTTWQRVQAQLNPGVAYDFIDIQQTNATTETYVYKTGGSGGTTVRTIVVVYTSSAKTDIDTVTYS